VVPAKLVFGAIAMLANTPSQFLHLLDEFFSRHRFHILVHEIPPASLNRFQMLTPPYSNSCNSGGIRNPILSAVTGSILIRAVKSLFVVNPEAICSAVCLHKPVQPFEQAHKVPPSEQEEPLSQ
jgi:hypothetical protein